MPIKTNRALLELIREALEQNAHGLITDWEAICACSTYASQGQTPHEGDIDPSTGLKYDGGTMPGNHSTSEPDPFLG